MIPNSIKNTEYKSLVSPSVLKGGRSRCIQRPVIKIIDIINALIVSVFAKITFSFLFIGKNKILKAKISKIETVYAVKGKLVQVMVLLLFV